MTDEYEKRIEELERRFIGTDDPPFSRVDADRRACFGEMTALASELAEKLEDQSARMGSLLVSPTEAVRSYAAEAAQAAKKGDVSEGLHAVGHLETVGLDLATELAAERSAHAETKRELERERKAKESWERIYARIVEHMNNDDASGMMALVRIMEKPDPPPPVSPVAEQPVEMGTGEGRCEECQDGQALGGNGPSRCAYCGRGCS